MSNHENTPLPPPNMMSVSGSGWLGVVDGVPLVFPSKFPDKVIPKQLLDNSDWGPTRIISTPTGFNTKTEDILAPGRTLT